MLWYLDLAKPPLAPVSRWHDMSTNIKMNLKQMIFADGFSKRRTDSGEKIGRLRRAGGWKERMKWRRLMLPCLVGRSSTLVIPWTLGFKRGGSRDLLLGMTQRRLACGQYREVERLKGSGFHDLEKKSNLGSCLIQLKNSWFCGS